MPFKNFVSIGNYLHKIKIKFPHCVYEIFWHTSIQTVWIIINSAAGNNISSVLVKDIDSYSLFLARKLKAKGLWSGLATQLCHIIRVQDASFFRLTLFQMLAFGHCFVPWCLLQLQAFPHHTAICIHKKKIPFTWLFLRVKKMHLRKNPRCCLLMH